MPNDLTSLDAVDPSEPLVHGDFDRKRHYLNSKRNVLGLCVLMSLLYGFGDYLLVSRCPTASLQGALFSAYLAYVASRWVHWDSLAGNFTVSPFLRIYTMWVIPIGLPHYLFLTRGMRKGLGAVARFVLLGIAIIFARTLGTILGMLIFGGGISPNT